MNWHLTTAAKQLVKLGLLLQFLAVSLMPQGMMTSYENNSFTLVICTPDGIKEISVPADGEKKAESGSGCVFSLHADQHFIPLTKFAERAVPPTISTNRVPDSHLTELQRHLAYGSRAPPVYS
ncbi:hypothetical protein WH95_13145 [Kiloniella litopenaei]|uniref:Uncharacterized protein n=1 Tax=Kiloniella litopenaei TaxID=1549748 RepID=A0A0M2R3G9_9PROT|nr:DUF2946 family protein [Kiloniella litopenaei]KKJ76422.1 hypothetical protein WH95_13145 [Kiloniella litopenaei]